jgi:ATP-binding cassette subfamily C protein
VPTLLGLTVLAAVLFVFLGALDFIRGCIVVLVGTLLDEALSGRVFDALMRLPLTAAGGAADAQPLRDLDTVRSFLTSPGSTALCRS